MSIIFLRVVNLSIAAGWLVLAVLILRLVLHKAPKWTRLLLWAVVALRLLCPISVETVWSLLPSAETVPLDMERTTFPAITSGVEFFDRMINSAIQQSAAPSPSDSVNPMQIMVPILAILWLIGLTSMLLYAAGSYMRLRRWIATAVRIRDNVYESEFVSAPFVLGLTRPKIYVPFGLMEPDLTHVLAHENAHIVRRDHWWKPLGFLLLSIYWFQPLLWIAYVLLSRDLELACDEHVIEKMNAEGRANYTQALVRCSVHRQPFTACPLAFGEVGVKERVRAVLRYEKPTLWLLILAVLASIAVAVCFLTGPKTARTFPLDGNNVADLDPEAVVTQVAAIVGQEDGGSLYMGADQFSQYFDADFRWDADIALQFFYTEGEIIYCCQLSRDQKNGEYRVTEPIAWEDQRVIFRLYDYLKALQSMPREAIRTMAPADRYLVDFQADGTPEDYDRVLTYTADGLGEIDGWYIHLRLNPLHAAGGAYSGTGDEVVHLFYGGRDEVDSSVMTWMGELFGRQSEKDTSEIAAVYRDVEISVEIVGYYREIFSKTRDSAPTEREVVDEIVGNLILVQKAEEMGLGATDSEVTAQLDATRQWYKENEIVHRQIEEYCAGAGISVEDYFSLLEVQLPNTIARAKLRDSLNDAEIDTLIEKGLEEVIYYID